MASSTTTDLPTSQPIISALFVKMSGFGLPLRPRETETSPSTLVSNKSSIPAIRRMARQFLLEETIATLSPRDLAFLISSKVDGKISTPSRLSISPNNRFFLFPSPQTVSRSGPSDGSPSGITIPREPKKLLTPL